MATQDSRLESGGFVPFYRSYTKTWIHAVATAGLTAFGTLTIVHRWFAALALASYVVPPVVLYLRHGRQRSGDGDREATDRERASESATETETEPEPDRAPSKPEPEPEPEAEPEPEPDRAEPASRGRDRGAEAASAGGTATEPEPETIAETTTETKSETETETETEAETPEWHTVDAPTDATLRDAVVTEPNGPNDASDSSPGPNASAAYAVGDGGIVLASERTDEGDDGDGSDGEWTTVLEDGPAAGGNDLRGVDATADGASVWIAGDSGALGRINAETGRHTDYTAPEDITDNWLGVAVGGSSGTETVLLINGSGAILRGEYRDDGDDSAGTDAPALEWTGPDKPGSGSSFSGVALADETVGYCCDTNDGVYETTDGGDSFERVGLEGADGTLTDVATAGRDDCLVSADDGVVHRYDGPTWTPERVADAALTGVTRREGLERTVACADDGTVYERTGPAADWERFETGAPVPLLAVSLASGRAVAVGEDGAIAVRG